MITIEELLSYSIQFWAVTALVLVLILDLIVSKFDNMKKKVDFSYNAMPVMQPIPIRTKGKGIWTAFRIWVFVTRNWELTSDFHYTIDGQKYVIPAGFQFDGASVPKFLRALLSPVGILLVGGLVHDYGYKYAMLTKADGENTEKLTQKELDLLFRNINIEVNGFKTLNYLTYYSLRMFGFFAWNGHRSKD